MSEFSFGPIDPFVFSRAFDARSPVSSGARHLSALATRLCFSVLFGFLELPESVWQEARALLTAGTLWGLCLVAGAWLVATIIGGPVGLAIDALILAYGLYELWPTVKQVIGDLYHWLSVSYWANNEHDLKRAGKHFAHALGSGSIAALQAIVVHRVFTRASRTMLEHFPVPEWLQRRMKDVETRRAKTAEEERGRQATKPLHNAAGYALAPAAKGVGAFPTGLVLGGSLAFSVNDIAVKSFASSLPR